MHPEVSDLLSWGNCAIVFINGRYQGPNMTVYYLIILKEKQLLKMLMGRTYYTLQVSMQRRPKIYLFKSLRRF